VAKRKKKEPEPKAGINKDMDPGHGLEILKLSDIIPDGRPVDVDGQRYTLLHPGALSLYQTAVVDKLRARWGELFRKWNSNECTEEETDELDEAACQLVPLISDVPEEVARGWTWRTRFQMVTLHFGFIAEALPNLTGAALPNRAVRRALARKGGASDGS
jgi:hypothetical protein